MRRNGAPEPLKVFNFGDVSIDPVRREVTRADAVVEMTAKEFDLVLELMKARGRVLTRHFLMDHVWGYDSDSDSRTLDTHVRRLRDKLGPEGERLQTVRGVGYRFDVPRDESGE